MPANKKELTPNRQILVVTSTGLQWSSLPELNQTDVGEKAWGLACLPENWTLPYFVISDEFISDYLKDAEKTIANWVPHILRAAKETKLDEKLQVYLRSSAPNESTLDHGKYISTNGNINTIGSNLENYIKTMRQDKEIRDEAIPIIIQKASVVSHKGHLSNERRCYKESRDWHGQYESKHPAPEFNINLRNWRVTTDVRTAKTKPLECKLAINIQNTLTAAAAWGYEFNNRLHFEWVWDGKQVFIVQVDKETISGDFDPTSISQPPRGYSNEGDFKVLQQIRREHSERYSKVHNAYVYQDLKLGRVPLYILEDHDLMVDMSNEIFSEELESDLKILTSRSLVIRTDLDTDNRIDKQMLPRTNEVRTFEVAKKWLSENSKSVLANFPDKKVAFIFHNFIPSEASAFAFAAPRERKVEIESLWGIPEGLYYNSHDKYIVDTKSSQITIAEQKLDNFAIKPKINFKSFCVFPNTEGEWVTRQVKPPFDWKGSIRNDGWLRKISLDSRKIAERENKSISIMWFAGVPEWASEDDVLPWFHEPYDKELIPRQKYRRTKTPFDEHYEIRSSNEIKQLQRKIESGNRSIRQILVKPLEETLLRDKFTLRTIGQLAKQIDAVILLEGATLSHAFYQLLQTGANIHVAHQFDIDEEKQEFNKLVRDKIPTNIAEGGELVSTRTLTGENLIQALREKLVEEAIEVLDATDYESIIEELSDVLEVIDALKKHLKTESKEIELKKTQKKAKAGGFEQGLILLETKNPAPSSSQHDEVNYMLDLEDTGTLHQQDNRPIPPPAINKWTDKRVHNAAEESILNLELPVLLSKWEADSQEITPNGRRNHSVKAKLHGKRVGSKVKLELSVYSSSPQLDLLDDKPFE